MIKSTLGLLKHKGKVHLNKFIIDSPDARKITGYVPESPILHELLTVREHVQFIASAYGIENAEESINLLFEKFDLTDKQDKLCKELSKGMQQKVSICCAAIIKPKVLFLDEPLIGLDPKAIRELKETILQWKNEGMSILISTHIIDSISNLWDRVFIMKQGKIVQQVNRSAFEEQPSKTLENIFFDVMEGVS